MQPALRPARAALVPDGAGAVAGPAKAPAASARASEDGGRKEAAFAETSVSVAVYGPAVDTGARRLGRGASAFGLDAAVRDVA